MSHLEVHNNYWKPRDDVLPNNAPSSSSSSISCRDTVHQFPIENYSDAYNIMILKMPLLNDCKIMETEMM
jgi:hypothetical protein